LATRRKGGGTVAHVLVKPAIWSAGDLVTAIWSAGGIPSFFHGEESHAVRRP
jgi:hypothetical protein